MTPTFVLTAVLDVLDLEAGGRETGLRFSCAQTGDFFDMPITQDQLEQVLGSISEVQEKLSSDAPPEPAAPPDSPVDPTLSGRGAVDMQPPLEHEGDPDMDMDDDDPPPLVLRTAAFGSHPAAADELEL